jgi:hypothetical protein
VAIERLDQLAGSDLLENGQIKLYYIELSEIIRQYIGGRYFVVALEMTTTEVLDGLEKSELLKEDWECFEQLLTQSDLVKFAKYKPQTKTAKDHLQLAYEIVDSTKLILEEAEEPESEIMEKDSLKSEDEELNIADESADSLVHDEKADSESEPEELESAEKGDV